MSHTEEIPEFESYEKVTWRTSARALASAVEDKEKPPSTRHEEIPPSKEQEDEKASCSSGAGANDFSEELVAGAKSEDSEGSSCCANENIEIEVVPEGTDCSRLWDRCQKNKGHTNFIPAATFTKQDLPEPYRSGVYFKGIRLLSHLTVRIRVDCTSETRPDGYTASKLKGKKVTRYGSGLIHERVLGRTFCGAEVPSELARDGTEDTGFYDAAMAEWNARGRIEENLKHTIESTWTGKRMGPKLTDMAVRAMTPVVSAGLTMKGLWRLWRGDDDEYSDYDDDSSSDDSSDEVRKVFGFRDPIVSKGVLGAMKHGIKKKTPVRTIKRMFRPPPRQAMRAVLEGDRGSVEDLDVKLKFLNVATSFMGKIAPETMTTLAEEIERGDVGGDSDEDGGGDNNNEDDDDDSEDDYEDIDKLMDQLEEQYGTKSDDDGISDDEDIKDFDEDEEKEREMFGRIHPCSCRECTASDSPKRTGYFVSVLTARHVIYDEKEAKSTVVDLFYDDAENTDKVRHMYGVDLQAFYADGDWAMLKCVTHDYALVHSLCKSTDKLNNHLQLMQTICASPLAIICSHPHGYFKQISIGNWTSRWLFQRRDRSKFYWTYYVYKTPTCPGSSGAAVLLLGYKRGTLPLSSYYHPHSAGMAIGGLNISGRHLSVYKDPDDILPSVRKLIIKEQKEAREKMMKETRQKYQEVDKKAILLKKGASKLAGKPWGVVTKGKDAISNLFKK